MEVKAPTWDAAIAQGHLRDLVHAHEHLPEHVHLQPVLEPTQVGEAEDRERRVALPVDAVREGLLLDDRLGEQVRRTGFGGCDTEVKDKRLGLGEARDPGGEGGHPVLRFVAPRDDWCSAWCRAATAIEIQLRVLRLVQCFVQDLGR